MMPALSTLSPIGAPVIAMMIGLSTIMAMNPQTMDGIAAKSSMTIFRASLVRLEANSDTYTAAPKPSGTASAMASPVTDNVPASSARMPYRGCLAVGSQFDEVKNSPRSSSLIRKGAPSRNTKKKMANTNRIALQPHSQMSDSIKGSVSHDSDTRGRCAGFRSG